MIINFNVLLPHHQFHSIGTTDSIVMFFVGAGLTLVIVLVVLIVIQIYKRRRQARKASSSVLAVETVEMQNQSPAEPSQNNQVCILNRTVQKGQQTFSTFVNSFNECLLTKHGLDEFSVTNCPIQKNLLKRNKCVFRPCIK